MDLFKKFMIMIIINETYKLQNSNAIDSYDIIRVVPETEKRKSNKPVERIISYGLPLERAIEKLIHIFAKEKIEDEDISLFEYIKILRSTTMKINKIINPQIESNE